MTDSPDQTGGMRSVSSPTPAVYPPPESMRPTLIGEHYMISAGHPLVAHAMAEVLEAGGTAIDAGVAGGFASNVIQPDMCNLGGIAPIVLRRAGEAHAWAISGVGAWGEAATLEAFHARYGEDMPLGSGVGVVPGAPDAWLTALERFGTWPLDRVLSRAIAHARDGWLLDRRTAVAIEILGRSFAKWESSRSIYWPEGRAPRTGERLRQSALAQTLQRLSDAAAGEAREAGIRAARELFYRGEIARRIVSFVQADGGWLTEADMAAHVADPAPAITATYRGWQVATPGPVTQGPVMLQALGILQRLDVAAMPAGGADALHAIAEALKLAFAERSAHACDPAFMEMAPEALLAPERLAALAARIHADRVVPPEAESAPPAAARPRSDTTCFCVVDAAGNAFSAMPSDTLDGAPIIPELGFFCSPRGVQSSPDPADVNRIAPGKRPRITPSPALALGPGTGGEPAVLAFGCPGGDVIVQAMLQAFLNVVDHGMSLQQAVEAPRVATFDFPGSFFPNPRFSARLDVEARIDPGVRADLSARGHDIHLWPEWEFDAGGVAMAGGAAPTAPEAGRVLAAGADPRRTHYAWGW